MSSKLSVGERTFEVFNLLFLSLLAIATLFPFWHMVVLALNKGIDTNLGGVWLWPRAWTMDNFRTILDDRSFGQAFQVTLFRTALGTPLALLFNAMVAYVLSRQELIGRKFWMWLFVFTMLFNGGIIPFFLLLRELQLVNSIWIYVLPSLLGVFNIMVLLTCFRQIPESLIESARLDGANDLGIFWRVVLPLSGPTLATIALFIAVYHWNDWFVGAFYCLNPDLKPLATYMQNMINRANVSATISSAAQSMELSKRLSQQTFTPLSIRAAVVVTAVLPILIVYPLLQRYFVSGMMIGSIKG